MFTLTPPRARETPVIVEVPHAGVLVPPHIALRLLAPLRSIARDADLFVDELYESAPDLGATLLVSHVSRYVVDLNRGQDDYDGEAVAGGPPGRRAPRGVIWRLTTEGERCLSAPLTPAELDERLATIHQPYHEALHAEIERKRARFGYVVVLAGHSMPSIGRSGHGDAGVRRADVVPGTQGRTTAAGPLIDEVEGHALEVGLTVRHDDPYRGGYTTRHYGDPASDVHAIQVELARRLYMDETTLRLHPGGFEKTRAFCADLVARLGAASPGGARGKSP